MHTNNIVSDNLPIYFIWFGSDVPPKYFGNLQRAAETNKLRDIILVYSEKHLLPNNRKNIDSLESIKINEIKERVELKRDGKTQNLFKIDVYDMELDKQDGRIYDLLDTTFMGNSHINGKGAKSLKYCFASDIIRLPLLNATGGIYLDMDTEVISEVGEIETKNGYSFHFYYSENDKNFDITGNIIAKARFCNSKKSKESELYEEISFQKSMENYIGDASKVINGEKGDPIDPVYYLCGYIARYYIQNYFEGYMSPKIQRSKNGRWWWKVEGNTLKYSIDDSEVILEHEEKIDDEQFKIYQSIISDYSINVPKSIKLKMKQGEGYNTNYNNPEDLKKLGLDKQNYNLNSELENPSLEQQESIQEKGR